MNINNKNLDDLRGKNNNIKIMNRICIYRDYFLEFQDII